MTLQLWSHHLGYPLILSHISVTRWLICQMLHNAQDKFTKEATHLQGLLLVLSILAEQFCLFLTQVLLLQTMILIGRMLLLLILLLTQQLIDLHLLLTHSQNPVGAIILMNNWPTYSANLLTLLMLIRLLDLILI